MFGLVTLAGSFSAGKFVSGQQTLDIKTPGGMRLLGEKKGTVDLVPKEHTVNMVANMSTRPKEGKVFEGWIADVGGFDYKLSLTNKAESSYERSVYEHPKASAALDKLNVSIEII